MNKRNHSTTNNAGVPPAPPEAHQRADVGLIRDLVRFCKGRPYSLPCVVFGSINGQFVKV